ncbi:MAG: putative acetyltransferase [Thermoleophilia bacterium]|nr:putative acetyltransferase [Thermoleophilia bacterium]
MSILLLDTATTTLVVALLDPATGSVRGTANVGRAQGLVQAVDELLADAGPASLEAVVVGTGPGGFTGLRVGVATARGLAETLGIPLHGVDSGLAVAAIDVEEAGGEPVWSVLDARRGERFARPWRLTEGGRFEACGPLEVVPVAEVDAVVGDARRVGADAPTPESLARAARDVLADSDAGGGDPLAVVPSYGRSPDAEPRRMDVRVDALEPGDLDRLLVLERRCFATPWTRGMYTEELARPDADAVRLAAREGDDLLGAALASRIGGTWHVMNVLVDPRARRRGIAGRLVDALLERSAQLGAEEGWVLEVRDGNDAAIALYARRGFEARGRRRRYYAETGEDAIVMLRPAGLATRAVAT